MRTIVAGTTSAITFGMAGSALCIPFFGTAALPFMICSTFGYVYGMLGFYLNAVERAHVALERYPTLMLLHMDANFPRHRGPRSGAILEAASKSWILQSMLVVSWLTAQPALSVRVGVMVLLLCLVLMIGRHCLIHMSRRLLRKRMRVKCWQQLRSSDGMRSSKGALLYDVVCPP